MMGADPESEMVLNRFMKAERFIVYTYKSAPILTNPNAPIKKIPPGYDSEIKCYIINNVAKYGICKTKQEPNWGFCSKSCLADSLSDKESFSQKDDDGFTRYEVRNAYLYEDYGWSHESKYSTLNLMI